MNCPQASREDRTRSDNEDTKTQIVKALAEKLEAEPKQIQSFLDALAEMATEQTREAGEFTLQG